MCMYICIQMYVQIGTFENLFQLLTHLVHSGNGVSSVIGEVSGCMYPDVQVMFLK